MQQTKNLPTKNDLKKKGWFLDFQILEIYGQVSCEEFVPESSKRAETKYWKPK